MNISSKTLNQLLGACHHDQKEYDKNWQYKTYRTLHFLRPRDEE